MKVKRFVPGGKIKVLCAENRNSGERVAVGSSADRKRILISVLHKPRLNELRRGRFMTHRLTLHSATRGGMVTNGHSLTLLEATALLRLLSDVLFQLIVERRQLAKRVDV